MDNKDTMTTERLRIFKKLSVCLKSRIWHLRKVKNMAIWDTIIAASSFLLFFGSGDNVYLWGGLGFMPMLVFLWATVFQGRVGDAKLVMVAGVGSLVIFLVGWYLTNSWWVLGMTFFLAEFLVVFGGWKIWQHLQTKD